jgi:hypothetical protein
MLPYSHVPNYDWIVSDPVEDICYVNYDVSELPSVKVDKTSPKSRSNVELIRRQNFIDHEVIRNARRDSNNYIIWGKEGIGKTELAKYILDYKCIVIERMEDLKGYSRIMHKGIIFENIDFSNIDDDIIPCLVEKQSQRIKLQDRNIELDKNVRLIFTTRIDRGKLFGIVSRLIYKKFKIINLTRKPYTNEEDS